MQDFSCDYVLLHCFIDTFTKVQNLMDSDGQKITQNIFWHVSA